MAIMGGAALVGGSGMLAVETVGMIAFAAGVVGAVTQNKTLLKISAGLGLGTGISSLLDSAGAATSGATEAGTSAINDATDAAAAESATSSAVNGSAPGTFEVPGDNVVPAAANGVSEPQGLIDQTLQDTGAASPKLTGPGTMDQMTTDALKPAGQPGATFDNNSTFNSDYGFRTNQTTLPNDVKVGGQNQTGILRSADSFFGDTMQSIKDWWSQLKPSEKLVVGQMGAGLVSGIGKGIMDNQQLERKMKFEEEARDYRRANLAGVPTIGYQRPATAGLVNRNL